MQASNNAGYKSKRLHDVAVDLLVLVERHVELPQRDDRDADEGKVSEKSLNFSTDFDRKFGATIRLHFCRSKLLFYFRSKLLLFCFSFLFGFLNLVVNIG